MSGGGTSIPTVALVDDHELLLHTVTAALEASAVDCVAVRPKEQSALLNELLSLAPTAVLLDLDLGDVGPATPLIAPLTAAGIRVLLLTGSADRMSQARALDEGAIGVQSKSAAFDDLLAAIDAAVAGDPVNPIEAAALHAELAQHRRAADAALRPFRALTDREQHTLRALADGLSVADIAKTWVISRATVRSHVQSLLGKLGVGSQLEAVAAARTSGWLGGA